MKILINICENIKDLLSLRNIVRDMTQEEDIIPQTPYGVLVVMQPMLKQ